jgi:hypothetical protein
MHELGLMKEGSVSTPRQRKAKPIQPARGRPERTDCLRSVKSFAFFRAGLARESMKANRRPWALLAHFDQLVLHRIEYKGKIAA